MFAFCHNKKCKLILIKIKNTKLYDFYKFCDPAVTVPFL